MNYKPIMCPKCGQALRHRVISNLRFCVNPRCSEYHGIPPIEVDRIYRHDIPITEETMKPDWYKIQNKT
jgi:Zn-finger nucleic acid-binding protein